MVHDTLVARPQLDRPNVPGLLQIDREDKIPKDIAATSAQPVRFGHLHHQVGRAHLPPFGEMGLSRQIGGLAFGPAFLHPLGDKTYLSGSEAAFTDEIPVTRLGQPWGHVAALGDCDNLRGVPACVFVSEQRERRRFSRAVAWRAILKDQRGYVLIEGDRFRRQRKREQRKDNPFHFRFSIVQPTALVSRRRILFPATTAANTSSKSCWAASGLDFPISA